MLLVFRGSISDFNSLRCASVADCFYAFSLPSCACSARSALPLCFALPLSAKTHRESAIAFCLPVRQLNRGLATVPCLGELPRGAEGLDSPMGYTGFWNYGAMLSRLGSALASSRQAQGPLGNMADEMDCCMWNSNSPLLFQSFVVKAANLKSGFVSNRKVLTANCWESLLPALKVSPSKICTTI